MRRAKDHLVITDDSNGDPTRTNSSGFSSMADVAERDTSCVSCTTFNILAPFYKRLDSQNQRLRGSDFKSLWLARNQRILDWLLYESSSIMCFQEFWVGNEELVQMYEERLGNAGSLLLKLAQQSWRCYWSTSTQSRAIYCSSNHLSCMLSILGCPLIMICYLQGISKGYELSGAAFQ